jgi:hypothetical protein
MAAKKLDPRLIEILKEYGEDANQALWDCHGVWVAYHKAIERIAAKAGVVFDMPVVIEANTERKVVSIVVAGSMGDKREWSFGEASPANCKNSYVYAMAEKRAKDRVVLKLVGLHGMVYSEEESDDFKPQSAATPNTVTGPAIKANAAAKPPVDEFPLRAGWEWQAGDPPSKSSAKLKEEGGFGEFSDDLNDCLNLSDLKWVEDKWIAKSRADGWPVKWKHAACDRIEGRETAILQTMSPEHLADVPLDKALKQSLNVLGAG